MYTDEWRVERRRGHAAELLAHRWDEAVEPTIAILDVIAPALVLGSTQSFDIVDHSTAVARGTEVARRPSGGGAVLVEPSNLLWIEVVVPSDHPRWDRDVGRATWWLGEAWAYALEDVGVYGSAVHTSAISRTAWSSLVCFAGMGAGEVSVEGRKVVGMSQRRVRSGALFQCAALLGWDPSHTLDLLVLDPGVRGEAEAHLRSTVGALDLEPDQLVAALVATIHGTVG